MKFANSVVSGGSVDVSLRIGCCAFRLDRKYYVRAYGATQSQFTSDNGQSVSASGATTNLVNVRTPPPLSFTTHMNHTGLGLTARQKLTEATIGPYPGVEE